MQAVITEDLLPPQTNLEPCAVQPQPELDAKGVVSTNAVNRNISHLNILKWCCLVGGTAALRTLLQHPFVVAMARKQSMREHPTAFRLLRNMRATLGMRSWFRGYFALATGMVVSEVFYMYLFESMRASLPMKSKVLKDAASGLVGDVTSTFIQVPFVVVANRQMTAGHGLASSVKYENSFSMSRRIMRCSGTRGMFSGLGMSLMLAPHSGFWWGLYGVVKEHFYRFSDPLLERMEQSGRFHHLLSSREDNIIVNSLAGFCSSVVVMTAYNPVIVVRTRWQVMDGIPAGTKNIFWYIVRDLYRNEGWRGFFKGTVLNVSTSSFDGFLFALLYELTKQYSDTTKQH